MLLKLLVGPLLEEINSIGLCRTMYNVEYSSVLLNCGEVGAFLASEHRFPVDSAENS